MYTQYLDKYGMPKIANEEELKTVRCLSKVRVTAKQNVLSWQGSNYGILFCLKTSLYIVRRQSMTLKWYLTCVYIFQNIWKRDNWFTSEQKRGVICKYPIQTKSRSIKYKATRKWNSLSWTRPVLDTVLRRRRPPLCR